MNKLDNLNLLSKIILSTFLTSVILIIILTHATLILSDSSYLNPAVNLMINNSSGILGSNMTISWQDNLADVSIQGKLGINTNNPAATVEVADGAMRLVPTSEPINPANGMIYYDSGFNKFRCRENNIWKECTGMGTLP